MAESRSWPQLALFLIIVAAVAMSGVTFQPGTWYAGLAKPFWTPPNWLFPPVWTLLYIMIAVAGWLIFATDDVRLKGLWVAQLIFNALWSWLFFGQHWIAAGLIDITAMLISIAALVTLAWPTRRRIAWLMLPYLAWVAYASSLNAAILILN
jgi:tryptophan-rich sensory protein